MRDCLKFIKGKSPDDPTIIYLDGVACGSYYYRKGQFYPCSTAEGFFKIAIGRATGKLMEEVITKQTKALRLDALGGEWVEYHIKKIIKEVEADNLLL